LKKLFLFILFILLISNIVNALVISPIGNGSYQLTLSDGRTAIAYDINWDNKNKILSFKIDSADGKGLRLKDILEIRDYAQTIKGRNGLKDRTQIIIR